MSGIELLVDTNIILYLLNGNREVANVLQDRSIAVSVITEMELLSFHGIQKQQEKSIKAMFTEITVIEMNTAIKNEAISLRRKTKLKLPDAIIASTAVVLRVPLFTADVGFKNVEELQLLLLE